MRTEALVAPLAHAAGVRTPQLVAWARDEGLAYSIWERVDGELLDDRPDPLAWRHVGRELAKLHAIARVDDVGGVLAKPEKRDARPWLPRVTGARADFYSRWLERLAPVPAVEPRVTHADVHGCNVLCGKAGVTLIDWGDATWADPASEFAAMPIAHLGDALEGYEEVRSLGHGAEARVLRAIIGQAVRMLVARDFALPIDQLEAWLRAGPPLRFREWLPPPV